MMQINEAIEITPCRLPPARSFTEATAMVEAALGQLRNAEAALERQLSTLQDYMLASREAGAVVPALPQ